MLGDKALAEFTRTPVNTGQQAFIVDYVDPSGEGSIMVLADGSDQLGEQIRETLFSQRPNATDYNFERCNYRAFQYRLAIRTIMAVTMAQFATEPKR